MTLKQIYSIPGNYLDNIFGDYEYTDEDEAKANEAIQYAFTEWAPGFYVIGDGIYIDVTSDKAMGFIQMSLNHGISEWQVGRDTFASACDYAYEVICC